MDLGRRARAAAAVGGAHMQPENPLVQTDISALDAPLDLHRESVVPEWIDYNGHMNVAYYVLAFDHATDVLFDLLGMDAEYRARTDASVFVVESHVIYKRELRNDDPIAVSTQLLGFDAKRLHLLHVMRHARDGFVAASNELMVLHVDYAGPRASPFEEPVRGRVRELWRTHRSLPVPREAGRRIALPENA